MSKVDGTSVKIKEVENNCESYRNSCHEENKCFEVEIARKIDELQKILHDNFLKLSVQVAKLEK